MKRLLKIVGYLVLVMVVLVGVRHLVGYAVQEDPAPVLEAEKALRARADRIHQEAIVVDGHNDILLWVDRAGFDLGMDGGEPDDRSPLIASAVPVKWFTDMPRGEDAKTNTDLTRLETGGVNAQFFAVYESCKIPYREAKEQALSRIRRLREHESRYSDQMEIATTVGDINRISAQGKLAALMGMEGGHMIDDSIANLAMFHKLGVRYMTLTHACSLKWADSATDKPVANGLSDFGKSVVKEMNRLGMIVDISHVSDKTFWDALQVSKAPIVATHSNARALCDSPRNLTDDMIRAIKKNNGLIGVTFLQGYVDEERKSIVKNILNWYWFWNPKQPGTPISKLVDHIDHIVELAGIDHVGIGSDFDGAPFFLDGLENVDQIPNLTYALLKRGYSEAEIKKILGGNFLRVMADVQEIAVQND